MTVINERPLVVGIAGGSASGKSTLACELRDRLKELNVVLLHADSYYQNPVPTTIAPFTGKEYPDFNHPDSLDWARLVADLDAAVGREGVEAVIVEGILVLHMECIRQRLDLKLFVDCRADERVLRRLKRYHEWMGVSYEELAAVYLDSVRYRHDEFVEPSRWYADLVVNGSGFPEQGTRMVTEWIRGCTRQRSRE